MHLTLISIARDFRYSNAGVDQLAAHLRRYYDVEILYFHNKEKLTQIKTTLLKTQSNLYGFSVYSSNLEMCKELSDFIKEKNRNACIFWGGSFVTQYRDLIRNQYASVDYYVLGDGELPVKELLACIYEGSPLSCPHILPSMDSSNREYVPYHNTIFPDLPAMDYYENDSEDINRLKTHCLQSKNNICTGHCSFCFERHGEIIFKDVETIVKEIEYVAQKYHIRKFFITDDNFFDPNTDAVRDRLIKFCSMIRKLPYKLIFTCYATANSLKNTTIDKTLLQELSDIGFASMFIGIESGNELDLKLYQKKARIEDNHNIVSLLLEANIDPIIGFIHLNPYSSPYTLKENISYLHFIKSVNLNNYINSFLDVYPGTLMWKKCKADNLLKDSYSYIKPNEYYFKNDEVQKVATFVREKLNFTNDKFEITMSQLLLLYYEFLHMDSNINMFTNEIMSLRDEYHEKMHSFFRIVYCEMNLEKAQDNLEEFVDFLRSRETKLVKLRKSMCDILIDDKIQLSNNLNFIKGMYN